MKDIKDIEERVKSLSNYNLVGDLKTVLSDIVQYLKEKEEQEKSK